MFMSPLNKVNGQALESRAIILTGHLSGKASCRKVLLFNLTLERRPFSLSEHGFVDVKPSRHQNISAKLQENVELRVEIEAYPPPQVRWSKDGATIKGDKTIITRQEQEIR